MESHRHFEISDEDFYREQLQNHFLLFDLHSQADQHRKPELPLALHDRYFQRVSSNLHGSERCSPLEGKEFSVAGAILEEKNLDVIGSYLGMNGTPK
jgi:hypothetical protein